MGKQMCEGDHFPVDLPKAADTSENDYFRQSCDNRESLIFTTIHLMFSPLLY